MSQPSSVVLGQLLQTLYQQLVIFQAYHQTTPDPYVRSTLNFVIEDTHEAIARTSSRLRQLGENPLNYVLDETTKTGLRQSRNDNDEVEQLRLVWRALKQQLDWYQQNIKTLLNDADTQAILVALAEQTRVRLERWQNLMAELKVSPNN
jgi:hypothetical protein